MLLIPEKENSVFKGLEVLSKILVSRIVWPAELPGSQSQSQIKVKGFYFRIYFPGDGEL